MSALLRLARGRAARLPPVRSRCYGTSLPIPKAPPGSETIFHTRTFIPKYSLSNPKWFALFFAANIGGYAGHYFYLKFLMSQNPPNPPRDPNEEKPTKHMHSADEE